VSARRLKARHCWSMHYWLLLWARYKALPTVFTGKEKEQS
jgi:hypothetical protein